MTDKMECNPKYLQIRNQLYRLIQENLDTANYKLPSENQICTKYNVSRITAKSAYGQLEKEGLITKIQGKGTFINVNVLKNKSVDLSARKTKAIALIISVLDLQSRFMTQIIEGAESCARTYGYTLLILKSNNNQRHEQSNLKKLMELGVEGSMIYLCDYQRYNQEILKFHLGRFPIVLIDRYLPGINIPCVSTEHYNAASALTAHLIGKGHKRIGFITSSSVSNSTSNERYNGYAETLEEFGVECRQRYKNTAISENFHAFDLLADEYFTLNKDLTAVITLTSHLAHLTYRYLIRRGVRVPQDMALCTFDDDHPRFYMERYPDFTCIVQNSKLIGETAAKYLVYTCEKKDASQICKSVGFQLHEGETT